MGKKRIKFMGEQAPEKTPKKAVGEAVRPVAKSGKQHGRITDVGAEMLAEAEAIEKKAEELEEEVKATVKKSVKKAGPQKIRGRRYQAALKKIDRTKAYSAKEAVSLIKDLSFSNFKGSVDAHLVLSETGLKGEVEFPHSTGKSQVIRVADDKLLKELETGKINFNALVASPEIMPKLVKFAKVLGPRGLMPNPKAGTISKNPEELAKKMASRTMTTFKTETKAPLVHLSIGKLDMKPVELEENFLALIKAIGPSKIQKAILAPTMGPGIKINLETL